MIDEKVDDKIKAGTEIPKAGIGTRPVTKIVGDRIYARVGVKTKAEKYTTKQMIKFAYNELSSFDGFNSDKLRGEFPREFSQGGCVFSMTGGILVLLGEASCIKDGNRYIYIKKVRDYSVKN